jgi:hypothetical protein
MAVHIILGVNDFTNMNADPRLNSFGRVARVLFRHQTLYFDGAPDSIDRTGELHEKCIPDGLYLSSPVSSEGRSKKPSVLFEQPHHSFLGEQGVTDNVGEHYYTDSSFTAGPFQAQPGCSDLPGAEVL